MTQENQPKDKPRTTGIDDPAWLDAQVITLSDEVERLRRHLTEIANTSVTKAGALTAASQAIQALTGLESSSAIMDRREAAIMMLSLADAETPEQYRSWHAHWADWIDGMAMAEHGGDCTKAPGPCPRCHADEAYALAPAYQLTAAIAMANSAPDPDGCLIDRRQAALMHLALMDVDSPEDALNWHQRWHERLEHVLAADHAGDCTDVPMTCQRCLAEEAHAMAPVYQTAIEMALRSRS